MDISEAVKTRHSVRSYTDRRIDGETVGRLTELIDECNRESGLNIQLCLDDPDTFSGTMAHYGKFLNVRNYIAMVGKNDDGLDEKCGYFGEKIVLEAQQLGLNTCWVALTFSKRKSKRTVKIGSGEKLLLVISLGYGETQGVSHKTKTVAELSKTEGEMPEWFLRGMESAQLAPTAINQQKFVFELEGDKVKASPGSGFYTKVDLGIAKYHFEIGAGKDGWDWSP